MRLEQQRQAEFLKFAAHSFRNQKKAIPIVANAWIFSCRYFAKPFKFVPKTKNSAHRIFIFYLPFGQVALRSGEQALKS